MEIRWSAFALDSMVEILKYIELNFGKETSFNAYQRINEHISLLKNFPFLGVSDNHLNTPNIEVRHLVCSPSVIYYLIDNNIITVASIFDCRQSKETMEKTLNEILKLY